MHADGVSVSLCSATPCLEFSQELLGCQILFYVIILFFSTEGKKRKRRGYLKGIALGYVHSLEITVGSPEGAVGLASLTRQRTTWTLDLRSQSG